MTDKDPLTYACGEEMVFTLTPMGVDGTIPEGEYKLKWDKSDDYGVVEKGEIPFTGEPFIYKTKMDKPGFVRLQSFVVDRDGKKVERRPRRLASK